MLIIEDEIIAKLKTALSEPIEKECHVVYILVEIRKLLDRLKDKNTPLLYFYTNWVLHEEISKKISMPAIHHLLDEIEQTLLNKKYDSGAVIKIIDFEEFCNEIGIFLTKFNMQNPFTDRRYWDNFRGFFVDILVDCPLKLKNSVITDFRFVKPSQKGDIDYRITYSKSLPTEEIKGSFSFLN